MLLHGLKFVQFMIYFTSAGVFVWLKYVFYQVVILMRTLLCFLHFEDLNISICDSICMPLYDICPYILYSIFILLFCLYHNLNSVIVNWDINAYVYLSPKKYKPTCLPPASLLSLSFTWEPNFMKKKSTVDVFTSLTLSFCFIPVWLPLHLFWKLLS